MPITRIETECHIHELIEGVVHIKVKPVPPTDEGMQESYSAIRQLSPKSKALILVDPREGIALSKKQRREASKEFNEFVSGMAMINNNLLAKLVFNLVMKQEKLNFKMKLVKSHEEGVEWLKSL